MVYCRDYTPLKTRVEHWKIYIFPKESGYQRVEATREYRIGRDTWETINDMSIVPFDIELDEDEDGEEFWYSSLSLKEIHALLKGEGWHVEGVNPDSFTSR